MASNTAWHEWQQCKQCLAPYMNLHPWEFVLVEPVHVPDLLHFDFQVKVKK